MSEHTPIPWVKDGYGDLRGADGELVTVWGLGIGLGHRFPDTEANSAYIMLAVNSHKDLLEALEEIYHMARMLTHGEGIAQTASAALKKAKP